MDVYDRLQPEDLKQAAVIVAGFVYDAAMRDEMLPRKPIEKALPKEWAKKDENERRSHNLDIASLFSLLMQKKVRNSG